MEPLTNPFVDPLADPFVDPLADPFVDPLVDPLADPLADPLVDTLADTTRPTHPNESMFYIGAAEDFKARYRNHLKSFKSQRYEKETELSKFIWQLKKRNINYTIKWKILKKSAGYNPISKKCNLCLSEKLEICSFVNKKNLINKRNELISKCRHENKFLLVNQHAP